MSTTIIKKKKPRTPVFYAECPCCSTEFTHEGEDVTATMKSQIEGTADGVRCPRCNHPFWADREIYTYLLK